MDERLPDSIRKLLAKEKLWKEIREAVDRYLRDRDNPPTNHRL